MIGTGKTLSLLCASLAWLEQYKIHNSESNGNIYLYVCWFIENQSCLEAPVQIIYASRTHSQLAQVVKEFKSTDYKWVYKWYAFLFYLHFSRMKITVLGSRDQLCVHPEVKSLENSADKISVCREKVHRKTCLFHRNVESILVKIK
jgi:regulator of telomere elongation helicase 1